MPRLVSPHPDLELGYSRQAFDYACVMPDGGIRDETGLIFYIHGFGSRYNDEYSRKLLPFLANTYDCVAVAVDYQGAASQTDPIVDLYPDFLECLYRHHGLKMTIPAGLDGQQAVDWLFPQLAAAGIRQLHANCRLIKTGETYLNFGLLPALDHLQVAACLLSEYRLNRRRLFVLGTSYGGYVGLMLAKLAPNTFRLVVDNCGFSGPDDSATIYGASAWVKHVRAVALSPQAFSPNPQSPAFLNPARHAIRTIGIADHYAPVSDTLVLSYHGREDLIASPQAKIDAVAVTQAAGRRHDLRLIGASDLDGRLFKKLDHGLGASLRQLFQLSYQRWLAEAGPQPGHTDFDLGTQLMLPCDMLDYVFEFNLRGVRLTIC